MLPGVKGLMYLTAEIRDRKVYDDGKNGYRDDSQEELEEDESDRRGNDVHTIVWF